MGKPAGSPKTGGRKKGTPNRDTEALRKALLELKFKLVELIPQLPIDKQVDAYIKLLPYMIPRYKPVEHPSEKPSAKRVKVLLTMPSSGREANKGLPKYAPEEAKKIGEEFLRGASAE